MDRGMTRWARVGSWHPAPPPLPAHLQEMVAADDAAWFAREPAVNDIGDPVLGGTQGAVPLAVQPADPLRSRGRVLRGRPDQRPGHQLAGALPVRTDLPADRVLPVRHLQLVFFFVVGGVLLAKLDLRRAIVGSGNVPPEHL